MEESASSVAVANEKLEAEFDARGCVILGSGVPGGVLRPEKGVHFRLWMKEVGMINHTNRNTLILIGVKKLLLLLIFLIKIGSENYNFLRNLKIPVPSFKHSF